MVVADPVEHKVQFTYQLNFWITVIVLNKLRLHLLAIIWRWVTVLSPSSDLPSPLGFPFTCVILVIWVFLTFIPVFPLASLLESLLSCWSRLRNSWPPRPFSKPDFLVGIILLYPALFQLLCLLFYKFLLSLKTHKSSLMLDSFLRLIFLSRN